MWRYSTSLRDKTGLQTALQIQPYRAIKPALVHRPGPLVLLTLGISSEPSSKHENFCFRLEAMFGGVLAQGFLRDCKSCSSQYFLNRVTCYGCTWLLKKCDVSNVGQLIRLLGWRSETSPRWDRVSKHGFLKKLVDESPFNKIFALPSCLCRLG